MSKFCTKCGKQLSERDVCDCIQQTSDTVLNQVQQEVSQQMQAGEEQISSQTPQNGEPVAPQMTTDMNQATQQGLYQQQPYPNATSPEVKGMNGHKDKMVTEAKNIVGEIRPLLKQPFTQTKKLADKNTVVFGLELVGVKAVVAIIIMLIASSIANGRIGNVETSGLWGAVESFASTITTIPISGEDKVSMAFMIILSIAGIDILEAVFLKVCAGIVGIKTNFAKMITLTGTKALFDIMMMIVAGIIAFVSVQFGIVILLAGTIFSTCVQYGAFDKIVNDDNDKKVYIIGIVKVVMAIILLLIVRGMIPDSFKYMINNVSMF